MSTLSRWILSHKLIVVLFWLATAIAGVASSSQAVNALSQQFTLPGREAYETNHTIVKIYGNGGGDTNPLVPVITLPAGTTVDTPGVRAQLRAAFARADGALPHARIVSYATTGNPVFNYLGAATPAATYTVSRGTYSLTVSVSASGRVLVGP